MQAWGEPRAPHGGGVIPGTFSSTVLHSFLGGLLQDAKNIWLIYAFLCQHNKDDADVGLLQWVQLSISSAGEGD